MGELVKSIGSTNAAFVLKHNIGPAGTPKDLCPLLEKLLLKNQNSD
jgi:hypothetical protein